jgi:hypothetical protein
MLLNAAAMQSVSHVECVGPALVPRNHRGGIVAVVSAFKAAMADEFLFTRLSEVLSLHNLELGLCSAIWKLKI